MPADRQVTILKGVQEYAEDMDVTLQVKRDHAGAGRLCLVAYNEGGYNSTWIDLEQLIAWLRQEGYL